MALLRFDLVRVNRGSFLAGLLDGASVYPRVLTVSEILDNYSGDSWLRSRSRTRTAQTDCVVINAIGRGQQIAALCSLWLQ